MHFSLMVNQIFNGPWILPGISPDGTILDGWVFKNLIWPDQLFAKVLRSFENCLLVSNNSCEQLVSLLELPIISDG